MAVNTAYLCEKTAYGTAILEYRSMDSLAVIPEHIEKRPVTALGPYLFSAHKNLNDTPHPSSFWQSDSGLRISQKEAAELPKVEGNRLEELRLPSSLKQVGAYGLYNCESLRRLELYSTTLDWGAGVFTGCQAITEVTIHIDESQKSCLKEILAELKQTIMVNYCGPEKAKLIFPEFFEEAVENTPARILVTNTHGCGQMYRNAFVQTQFQFHEYDRLFPHVQVQESEKLVTELAVARLRYPCRLTPAHREQYLKYIKEHRLAAACQAVSMENNKILIWLLDHISYQAEELNTVIQTASRRGNIPAVSILMDKTGGQGNRQRRRFSL